MTTLRQQILATRLVYDVFGEELPLHSHIPAPECELIQAWITRLRPRSLLEVGLAYGISSLAICEALEGREDACYHIIDPKQRQRWRSVGLENLRRAGYSERFVFHEEPSELCLPRLLGDGLELDFALIDGNHRFDHALVDFFYVNRMLRVGGAVVFDDAHLPSTAKLIRHITTYGIYEPLPLPGNAIMLRARRMLDLSDRLVGFVKVALDRREWDWHQDF